MGSKLIFLIVTRALSVLGMSRREAWWKEAEILMLRHQLAVALRERPRAELENRLVGRTLERALESKLAAQRQAERDLIAQQARRPVQLTEAELAWLARAGADVRAVFNAPSTTFRETKQLLRAILTEVVTVDTTARAAAVAIVWQGGARTELTMTMTKTGGHFQTTSEDTVELIRRLAVHYDDTTIALILGRQHRKTGTALPFTKSRVKTLRVSRGIPAFPIHAGPAAGCPWRARGVRSCREPLVPVSAGRSALDPFRQQRQKRG